MQRMHCVVSCLYLATQRTMQRERWADLQMKGNGDEGGMTGRWVGVECRVRRGGGKEERLSSSSREARGTVDGDLGETVGQSILPFPLLLPLPLFGRSCPTRKRRELRS